MTRDEHRWIPKKPTCNDAYRGYATIGLTEVKPVILLLLIGYALSLIILLLEIIFHRLNARFARRKSVATFPLIMVRP